MEIDTKELFNDVIGNVISNINDKKDSNKLVKAFEIKEKSDFKVKNGSSTDQKVDAIVNAANKMLMSGGGVCGAIFRKAGYDKLTEACKKIKTPLKDGDAVITLAFNIKNAKYIIHAVGPDFGNKSDAYDELFNSYYNSLKVLKENNLHSISFPLISSGIFGGNLDNPSLESAKQCKKAFNKFIYDYPDYKINVLLCAFTKDEYINIINNL